MSPSPGEPRRTSVIIPAYNSEAIRVAVDSAIAQTSSSLEIIVIDDGATDETAAGAESYGDRVRLLMQKNNVVQGAARNHGWSGPAASRSSCWSNLPQERGS